MKWIIYLGATVGGLIGGYIPVLLWHAGALSGWSLIFSTIGTIIGIFGGHRLSQSMDI